MINILKIIIDKRFEFVLTSFPTYKQFKNKRINMYINEIKKLFNNFKNAESGTKTKLDYYSTTLLSTLKDKTTFQTIGFNNLLENADAKGVTVIFNKKSHNDTKRTFIVGVTLYKYQVNEQKIEFTLTGYQTQVKRIASNTQDIQKEKEKIEGLDRVTINKLLSSINKNSLTKSELALGETPKGLSYEIIHDKITREGEFDITLKIKKGSQAIKAARKVLISFPKTSSLSKGDIAGIVIGVSLVTFVIIFIIYKFLKFIYFI